MSTPSEAVLLPSGYTLGVPPAANMNEILDLYEAVAIPELDMSTEDITFLRQSALKTVGVRGQLGELVGVGFLTGNQRVAYLSGLAVRPEHRHQGIAKMMIQSRVACADRLHIRHLETSLATTNSLEAYYKELGFIAIPEAEMHTLYRKG